MHSYIWVRSQQPCSPYPGISILSKIFYNAAFPSLTAGSEANSRVALLLAYLFYQRLPAIQTFPLLQLDQKLYSRVALILAYLFYQRLSIMQPFRLFTTGSEANSRVTSDIAKDFFGQSFSQISPKMVSHYGLF